MVPKNDSAPQNETDTNLYNPEPQGQTATSINDESNVASPMDNESDAQISGSQVQAAIPSIVELNVALPTWTRTSISPQTRETTDGSQTPALLQSRMPISKNPNLTTNHPNGN